MNDPVSMEPENLERKLEEILDESSTTQVDVIHVLRSAQAHHVSLSSNADQKANIVLGSYLVFLTVTQSLMEGHSELSIPITVLMIGYSIAAVFSLLVITPRFRDRKPVKGKPANLLFFGSFNGLSQDQYVEMLEAHTRNDAAARRLFMKDIYQIGRVLNKKYQNLRHSYTCLAGGIIAALIALIITSVL